MCPDESTNNKLEGWRDDAAGVTFEDNRIQTRILKERQGCAVEADLLGNGKRRRRGCALTASFLRAVRADPPWRSTADTATASRFPPSEDRAPGAPQIPSLPNDHRSDIGS